MSTALAEFLAQHGLAGCYDALAAEDVDLDILSDLTEAELAGLGLSLGERKRLLRAVASRQAETNPRRSGPGAERRRLSVMFCDLAGSTEIAARLDPEDFHELVSAHLGPVSAAITHFGGFIARYQGDGVLAYFGWPQASDNDAQRAASAALAVLKAVDEVDRPERLAVRVGVATGLVVVGDIIGEGQAREVVVAGETANLAARLQSAAAPGTALIAEETRALLGPAFRLGPARALALKGFNGLTQAWPLLGEQHQPATGGRQGHEIFARDAELAWLAERWQQAQAGAPASDQTQPAQGSIVLLRGEAGIGKSRISERFAASLAGPHAVLVLRAVQRHASTSLYPAANLLRDLAGLRAGESKADATQRLERLLRAHFADDDHDARLALLCALVDLPADERAMQRDPRQRKAALLDTLATLISRHTQPLLLLVEDVQWADATTLELLHLTAQRLAGAQALVLMLSRPEFSPPWPDLQVARRELGPLPEAASLALIEHVAGGALPAEVTAQILRRGDGVPLFIEEVTRAVLESGCLARGADGWQLVRSITAPDIPANLADSLLARIDRLGWVKELCQIGAVIGRDFQPSLLGAVCQQEAHRLDAGLAQLVNAGLLTEAHGAQGRQYSFRHALIHDTAYRSLLNSTRRDLHARVTAALLRDFPDLARRQPEMLGQHYLGANDHDAAAASFQRAGERDVRRAANHEAVSHLTRALEALVQAPASAERDLRELEIRRALSTAQIGVEGYTGDALRQNIEQALALSDRLGDQTVLLAPMAGHFAGLYSRGEMTQALHLGHQILRIAERTNWRGQRMAAHRLLGMAMAGAGDFSGAQAELQAAMALARPDKDAEKLHTEPIERSVGTLGYLALAQYFLGRVDEAEASDYAACTRARALGHPGTRVHAATLRSCLCILSRDDAALAQAAQELHEAAALQGSRPALVVAEVLLALAEAGGRDAGAALAAAAKARLRLREIGWNVMYAWTGQKQSEVNLALGRHDAARAVIEDLNALLTPRGYFMFRPGLLLLQAEILAQARSAQAPAMLAAAQAAAESQGAAFWQPRILALQQQLNA